MPLLDTILGNTHPDYAAAHGEWERNEARFLGGEAVRLELDPFQWEAKTDDSYTERRAKAMCPPLMRQAAEKFTGTLFEHPPVPDFGALGEVREVSERGGTPTRAELVYDYTDGTGADASGWDAFWSREMERACATGHRWVFCDAPPVAPETVADELAGRRPYLVGLSPLAVPDWHFTGGTLDYARVVTEERAPRVENGSFTAAPRKRHLLLVRAGFDGLGDEYAGGGWWQYEEGAAGAPAAVLVAQGTWEATDGEVPLWRLYYDREGRGLTDLGSAAVAAMNLLSALYHDAIVSGGRRIIVAGGDQEVHNTGADQLMKGSQLVTFPATAAGVVPQIHDVAAASASASVVSALEKIMETAAEVIVRELATSPDASGAAKRLEFLQGASPRLASMALHMEEAMWNGVRFLQMRWGLRPEGGVSWNKRYDLRSALEKAAAVLALLKEAGASSPTLVRSLVLQVAEREGYLTPDAPADRVGAELERSLGADLSAREANAARARGAADADARFREIAASIGAGSGSGGDGEAGALPETP